MRKMTRIALCVDDTDDLTKETSTGKVAEQIAACVTAAGGSVELGITRHQLLLDESVPYTSHNSSMAFTAWIGQGSEGELWDEAVRIVRGEMSAVADPGLCLALLPQDEDDALLYELVDFGRRAKQEYVSKAQTYELAAKISWLRLEELGGDGQGVVGALAGVGLRLSGSDGRFRGRYDLQAACSGAAARGSKGAGKGSGGGRGDGSGDGKRRKKEAAVAAARGDANAAAVSSAIAASSSPAPTVDAAPQAVSAAHLCDVLGAQVNGRVRVLDASCNLLDDASPVSVTTDAKPILFGGCLSILTKLGDNGVAFPCGKEELAGLQDERECAMHSCPSFQFDNDQEEFGATANMRTCPNCLFRRWTASGFTCMQQTGSISFSEAIA